MAARRRGRPCKVEKAIIQILKDRGEEPDKNLPLFDQAKDYGELWRVKENLLQDIAERGVTITQPSGVTKKNDSVDALVRINAQMLKILTYLRIEPSDIVMDEEEGAFSDDGL